MTAKPAGLHGNNDDDEGSAATQWLMISDLGITTLSNESGLSVFVRSLNSAKAVANTEVELISKGSSLKLCLVAEGSADVYPRFAPTMEWDTAAGQAIARYAGFKVLNVMDKNPMLYNKTELLNPWFIVE